MRISFVIFPLAAGLALAGACRSHQERALEVQATFEDLVQLEIQTVHATALELVGDGPRGELVSELLDAIQQDERALVEAVSGARSELAELTRDYEAPRADFEFVLTRMDIQRRKARARILKNIVAMQELMTDDEWSVLHGELLGLETAWEELVR